jgi:hypothetical protein
MAPLKFISLNTNGIVKPDRRRLIFSTLRTLNCDVILLSGVVGKVLQSRMKLELAFHFEKNLLPDVPFFVSLQQYC